jgi:histidinol-phosphate aminotransferase
MAKAHSPYSINSLTTRLATAALDDPDPVFGYAREVNKCKDVLVKALSAMGVPTFPSRANFVLAKFGGNCRAVEQSLREKGILVRDRSAYPLLKGCLRITIGTRAQTERLILALKEMGVEHGQKNR